MGHVQGRRIPQDLAGRPALDDLPVLEEEQPAAQQPGLDDVVGRQDDRPARAGQSQELILDVPRGQRIEVGCRLVGQQDLRVKNHRPGQLEALLFPARQHPDVEAFLAGQSDGREGRLDPLLHERPLPQRQRVAHVGETGAIQKQRMLEDESHPPPEHCPIARAEIVRRPAVIEAPGPQRDGRASPGSGAESSCPRRWVR